MTDRSHAEHGAWVSVHVLRPKGLRRGRVLRALRGLCAETVVIELQPRSMRLLGGPRARAERFAAVAQEELVPLFVDVVPVERLTRARN